MPLDTSAPGFGRTEVGRALRTLAGAGPPDGSHLGRGKVGDDVMGALKEFSTDKTQSERRLSRQKRASEGEGPSDGDLPNEAEVPDTPPSPIRASRKDSVPKSTRARLLADSDDGEDADAKTSQGVKSKPRKDQDADARVSVSDESPDPLERSAPEDDDESEEKEKDGAAETHDMSTSRISSEARSKPGEDEKVRKSSHEDSEAHEEENHEEIVSRASSQEAEAEALVSSASKERTSTRSSEKSRGSKDSGDVGAHASQEEAAEDEELHASQDDEVSRSREASRSRGSTHSVSSQRPSRKDSDSNNADETSYRRQNSRYFDDEPEPVKATSESSKRDQGQRSRKESVEKLEKRRTSVGSVDSLKDIPQKIVNHGGPPTTSKKSSKEVARNTKEKESEGKPSRQDLLRKKSQDEDSVRRASDKPEVADGTPPQSRRSSTRSQQNASEHEEEVVERQGSDVSEAPDATPPQSRRSSRSGRKSSLQEVARQVSDVSDAADATPPQSRRSPRSHSKTSQKKEVARQVSDVSDAADATPPQSQRSKPKTSQKKEVARQVSDVSDAADATPPQSRRSPRSSPKTSQKKEVARQVSDASEAADASPPQSRKSPRSSPKTSQKKEAAVERVSDVSATPSQSQRSSRSYRRSSQDEEAARQVSDVSEAVDATPPQSQRSSRSHRRASHDEIDEAVGARPVSEVSEAIGTTPTGQSRRLISDATKTPTSSSRKQEKPLDSRRNLAKQSTSTKDRLSKVDRSKSPKGSKMSTVMAPVPATTPSGPNLATARRSKQRSSIAEERTMARSNSRKELKDRKTSQAPEKVQVPEQVEMRPDKEQNMQTVPDRDEAGPGRISRWARARPAPEAVETAAVAVPGLVEEDALAVAQLDSSPPPPPPDGGAFYWPPPPPVALEMPTSYWPPPPPDVNFNLPSEAWDARPAPSPLAMATCGVSPLAASLGPLSPLSNHDAGSVIPPWHPNLGDDRREMQRQELMMLQQQQQILAFPPSLHLPQDNGSQVSPPPPSPTKLSPRRVDEATGAAHRLAHQVLTHNGTSAPQRPVAASTASPVAPVPQGAARQMPPPAAPVPAATAAVTAGGYPRSRELAEQKRQLEACQSTNRPMANQLHRQMRALQEQQQRLLQRNATAAASPRRTAAPRSASPIRSVSPLQQPGYTRAVSPETSVSRLHQPRVVARPAAHGSATVVTGTRAKAAQGMPLEPTTMRRMDQATVRSPGRNGVTTSPRSRSATPPRVESGPVRRVQSQTPPSPKGDPPRSLARSRSATPTPAPRRTVSPTRSKTPPKDPLAFKARRTPDTEKGPTSTPYRDASPTSRLPRKPAVPAASVVKAKSEKNLSSFLPDSKPMGFADKVTNALAKPASPRSDGKENVYLGFRNGHGQRDGFGVMQVENGPTYTGQWSGSKREGHGTLFFDKGVFEGQWIQGNAHGKGIVHFKNGDTFQGNYQQNRKCGFGTYTWADGTVESGDYLEGQKHGQHHWRRGDERWEMFYHQGALVATKRREEVEAARKNSAKSAEVSKSSDQKGKKEFVAQKLAMDKARPAPKPTPPPSPPSEQRAAVASTSTSSRCRSNSAFRAQGFTDEEIALMERKSPPSSPTHPLPDRAAQPGGSSARVFFPTSARARPASTAVAAPGKGLPSTGVPRVVPTSAAVPVAARAASTSSSSMAPAQAALAADAAAGAAVEPPPEPKPPEALDAVEPEVGSEEEAASEEPSTPGVHDG